MRRMPLLPGLAGLAAVLAIAASVHLGSAGFAPASAAGSASTDDDAQADPYKQAEALIDDDEYEKAIPLLQKLIKDKGAYADALNLLGYSYRKSGDAKQALEYYNQALAMEPDHLGANEYLGELYLEMKMPEEAKQRLAVLKGACGDCDEYEELEEKLQQAGAIN